MKAVVFLVVGSTLFPLTPSASTSLSQPSSPSQPSPLSPRELLDAQRPLTSTEIASVFAASHEALAGKTFRLSAGVASGPHVLMGSAGLPARIRMKYALVSGIVPASGPSRQWTEDITKIVDYTGRPARPCDGSTTASAGAGTGPAASAPGELAIEYTYRITSADRQPPEWTVSARRRPEREAGMPGLVFEMLRGVGSAGSLASGDHQPIDGRSARGFVTKFVPLTHRKSAGSTLLIGDPQPNIAGERPPRDEPAPMPIQTLWIDTESLLPLRWEVTDHGRRLHHYDFTFEPLDLSLPAELVHTAPPECIR
jgi:hypothetical protein